MFGIDDLLGAGVEVVGGLLGAGASAEDRQKALQANQAALQAWLDVNVPDINEQKVFLKHYVQTGQLTPAVEQAYNQSKTELAKVQADPSLKGRQVQALSALSDISNNGGMSLVDQANEQKRQNDIMAQDRGRRGAIADSFAARGMGGSGLELAAQLQGAQDATSRANEASLNTTASARQRALDAIIQGGQLAGSLRAQDYGEAKDAATAQDSINRFNTTNLQSVTQRNINRQNQAQEENLKRAQAVADANVNVDNSQEMHNKGLYQTNFNNQVVKAGGVAGQQDRLSDIYRGNADRTAGQWAGAGAAIGQGITAAQNASRKRQSPLNDYFSASETPSGTTKFAGDPENEDDKEKYGNYDWAYA